MSFKSKKKKRSLSHFKIQSYLLIIVSIFLCGCRGRPLQEVLVKSKAICIIELKLRFKPQRACVFPFKNQIVDYHTESRLQFSDLQGIAHGSML